MAIHIYFYRLTRLLEWTDTWFCFHHFYSYVIEDMLIYLFSFNFLKFWCCQIVLFVYLFLLTMHVWKIKGTINLFFFGLLYIGLDMIRLLFKCIDVFPQHFLFFFLPSFSLFYLFSGFLFVCFFIVYFFIWG